MSQTRERYFEWTLLGLILIFGLILFYEALPFLNGALGAITLYLLLRRTNIYLSRRFSPRAAPWIITLAVTLFVMLPLSALLWYIIDLVQNVNIDVQVIVKRFTDTLKYLEQVTHFDLMSERSVAFITAKATGIMNMFMSGINNTAINLFTAILLLFFLLSGGMRMERAIARCLPFNDTNKRTVIYKISTIVRSNAIGIPLLALIQGGVAAIGYYICDVKNPIEFGALTGFASMIPIVGSMLVWIPLAIIQYFEQGTMSAIYVAAYGALIISQCDNVLRMVLQKRMANTHPLITIFGVIAGLPLFGFMGLIFGPLMVAMFLLFLEMFVSQYIIGSDIEPVKSKKLVGQRAILPRTASATKGDGRSGSTSARTQDAADTTDRAQRNASRLKTRDPQAVQSALQRQKAQGSNAQSSAQAASASAAPTVSPSAEQGKSKAQKSAAPTKDKAKDAATPAKDTADEAPKDQASTPRLDKSEAKQSSATESAAAASEPAQKPDSTTPAPAEAKTEAKADKADKPDADARKAVEPRAPKKTTKGDFKSAKAESKHNKREAAKLRAYEEMQANERDLARATLEMPPRFGTYRAPFSMPEDSPQHQLAQNIVSRAVSEALNRFDRLDDLDPNAHLKSDPELMSSNAIKINNRPRNRGPKSSTGIGSSRSAATSRNRTSDVEPWGKSPVERSNEATDARNTRDHSDANERGTMDGRRERRAQSKRSRSNTADTTAKGSKAKRRRLPKNLDYQVMERKHKSEQSNEPVLQTIVSHKYGSFDEAPSHSRLRTQLISVHTAKGTMINTRRGRHRGY